MNTSFVKLPDGSYINPAHVTCISFGTSQTAIFTSDRRDYWFDGDRRDEFAKLLSGDILADVDMGLHTLAAYHSKAAEAKVGLVCQHECDSSIPRCLAEAPTGHQCTRNKGHAGDHSACGHRATDHDLHTWPQ
jgi:hypothetical protein